MKKIIRIVLCMIGVWCFSYASLVGQKSQKTKIRPHKVWVSKMDKSKKVKGYLTDLRDSLITISNFSNSESQDVLVNTIDEMKFRSKGKIGRGILYGALTGFSIGAILGFLSGDDSGFLAFTAGEKALILGTLLTLPGAVIGGIAGNGISFKIPINGHHGMYKIQKDKLKKYQLLY